MRIYNGRAEKIYGVFKNGKLISLSKSGLALFETFMEANDYLFRETGRSMSYCGTISSYKSKYSIWPLKMEIE